LPIATTAPEAAIFDVEGTLVDCVPLVLESWREVLHQTGHDFTVRDLQPYSGMDGEWMLEQLLPRESPEVRQRLLKAQGEHYRNNFIHRVPSFTGVRELFEALREYGVVIGIATTCKGDELAIYDEQMHVLDLVSSVACGETVQRGKPDPKLLSECFQTLRVADATTCVAVGDTPFDALAAQEISMPSIGVLTGGFSEQSLLEAGCQRVFDQVHQVRRLWQRNGAHPPGISALSV
jgi:phosphoglycolate phosphatase-like HAD superfamily hydrolase